MTAVMAFSAVTFAIPPHYSAINRNHRLPDSRSEHLLIIHTVSLSSSHWLTAVPDPLSVCTANILCVLSLKVKMGGLVETVLLGLLGAASIFFVEGQELTSTETVSKDKIINVGFTNFNHDDKQEDQLKTALQSDNLLSGKGPAWEVEVF